MKFLKIEHRDGFLTMEDLPHNCIFNKVHTGCGATTIVLENDQNYVVAVPTTELIVNKCYPTHDKDGNTRYWDPAEVKPGKSPVMNLFGLYGDFTYTLQGKLREYLKGDGVKKIICTYDKLPRLLSFISPKDFRLAIDEYHFLLKAYAYRYMAMEGLLNNFQQFKSYCFISATPIPLDFKPVELESVEELVADWDITRTIRLFPVHTDKPYLEAAKLIKDCKKEGYNTIDGFKSDEIIFFVNSVTQIKKILGMVDLSEDEYKIICADTDKNRQTLKPDYKISSTTSEPRRFTFVTSKAFEGVDFFSATALCVVITDVYCPHTMVSIDMDIPQIAGRIRTASNPLRNTIYHIYNTKPGDSGLSYEEKKKELQLEMVAANERVEKFHTLSSDAQKQEIEDVKQLGINSFLWYNKQKATIEVNDMVAKLKLFNHKIRCLTYSSDTSLLRAYQDNGALTSKVIWNVATPNEVKAIRTRAFRSALYRYVELKEQHPLMIGGEIEMLEQRYPILPVAWHRIGAKEMRRLRSETYIIQAVQQKNNE